MPDVAMTSVIPIAMTPTTLDWVKIARKLSLVGKVSGLRIAPTTSSAMITATRAYSWILTPARQREAPGPCRIVALRCRASSSISPPRRQSPSAACPASRRRRMSSSLASRPSNSATSSPSRMTRIREHRPQSSSSSDETTMTPRPCAARSAMMRNSSAFVATSTPRVGSSSSSTRHSCSSHRASTTFCWLPPERSRAMRSPSDGVVWSERSLLLRGRTLGADADQPALESTDVGQRHVLREAPLQQERLGLAVLRARARARRRWPCRGGRAAAARRRPAPRRRHGDRPRTRPAGARCDPTPPVRRCRAPLRGAARTSPPSRRADAAARALRGRRRRRRPDVRGTAARASARPSASPGRRRWWSAGSPEATVTPFAQDGDPVTDPPDLVEAVRDVDDADAVGRQPADDVEQGVDLAVVEDRRRLVHDQEADVVRERAGDRHDLLAGRPEIADVACAVRCPRGSRAAAARSPRAASAGDRGSPGAAARDRGRCCPRR